MENAVLYINKIKSDKTKRLGIFGGTFDPIHNGHLLCAQAAATNFDLDVVVFMIAGNPNFKQNTTHASEQDRINMCKLAVDTLTSSNNNEAFAMQNKHQKSTKYLVSDMEIKRGGVTYTSETLHETKAKLPQNTEIYFITGTDSGKTLPTWHNYKEVVEAANIVIVARPGDSISLQEKTTLQKACNNNLQFLDVNTMNVSSSKIRDMVKRNKDISNLVPEQVKDYIIHNKLYLCYNS